MRGWLALALVGCQQSAPTPAPTPKPPVTPPAPKAIQAKELFDHPEWIGTVVHVDLDAPMLDDEHSSIAAHGELDVEVEDVGAKRLALARADHTPITMARTIAPVHVVATLRDAPHGLRLEATSIEHFARPAPIKIARPSDIMKDPAKFSGVMVTFEADWLVGFEASIIDRGIWMEFFPDVKQICEPPPPPHDRMPESHTYHVRVIGMAHTAGHYGHMSMAEGQITATEVTYLDPKRPECR
jgi:hypothetical protein